MSQKRWTPEELKIMEDNWNKKSLKEVHAMLPGRTFKAMTTKAATSGISDVRSRWSDLELHQLKILWTQGIVRKEIARRLGRGLGSVAQMVKHLGLPPRNERGVKKMDLVLRVPQEVRDMVAKRAGKRGQQMSAYVRDLIERDLGMRQ